MKPTVSTDRPDPQLAEALALHQAGRLQEAEARYARILAREPGNFLARYYQGLARLQRGDLDAGIRALEQALRLKPDDLQARYDLGRALSLQGRHQQALPHFQRLVELQPEVAEGRLYLGMTLAALGRPEEALPHLERAAALKPGLAEAQHNLGSALSDLGRHEEAMAAFRRALAIRPDLAEARNGLGNALCRLGRYAEAGEQYKQALLLKPDLAEAYSGWGEALREQGRHPAARDCFENLVKLRPADAGARVLLGNELRDLGEVAEAVACYEQALALEPDLAEAHNELAGMLFLQGPYEEAQAHAQRAVELAPHDAQVWMGLLFNLHYVPHLPAEALAAWHRRFGESIGGPLKAAWPRHDNTPDPERPLRVGFVSGDFRRHPVGHFMADLLAALDKAALSCHAYVNQKRHDDLTERIRPHFESWREVWTLSDEALAAQIRTDAIDILVDLSGHTKDNRLPVFARKPAPVQVSYLGYFDTTGLTAMDYILGNRWLLPEAEAGLYTERPWRLPDAHLCFTPPATPIEVKPLPALQTGRVTFGCFNKVEKVNDAVIACWSRILLAMPGCHLFLKSKPLGDPAVAAHFRERFAASGIDEGRLILEGASPHRDYLECYNRVDIALDPFPYNGGTTSVEALWMGVPTLALKGDRYVAHMGESILQAMDLSDWIAADEDDYVAKAVAYAADLDGLAALRAQLRGRLLASPLCDAPRFARNFEAALRGMWRRWCAQQGGAAPEGGEV